MIRVILTRHAKPESPTDCPDDVTRPLSDKGRTIQQEMATRLHSEGIAVDQIFSSPLLRAMETAEILQKQLGGTITPLEALGANFDEQAILDHLQEDQAILLVGHDPTLAELANHLLGRREFPAGLVKSCALILEFEGAAISGSASLVDYIQPD